MQTVIEAGVQVAGNGEAKVRCIQAMEPPGVSSSCSESGETSVLQKLVAAPGGNAGSGGLGGDRGCGQRRRR